MAKNNYGYIYLTENLVNGKKYIGKHKSKVFEPDVYLGSGSILKQAIRKYGKENFKCTLIEWCYSLKSLTEREIYWISYYNACKDPNYYNMIPGEGYGFSGHHHTKKSKKLISNKLKISNKNGAFLNHKHTKKARDKMHLSKMNHPPYPKQQVKVSQMFKGIERDSDFKFKVSAGLEGNKNRLHSGRSVICIETQEIFNDCWEATCKYPKACIDSCLGGFTHTAAGYHWAYLDDKEKISKLNKLYSGKPQIKTYLKRTNNHLKVKVKCIETGEIFNSIKEANLRYHCSVGEYLRGKQSSAGGYHWIKTN